MKRVGHLFERIVTFENIYSAAKKAWQGKRANKKIASFYFNLENEVILLREELLHGNYRPGPYGTFEIREPKPRQICSSGFRDRVVHHAICNILGPIMDQTLIFDTFACRVGKGNHSAIHRAQSFSGKSKYFLKCDIRKYFPSIDHAILKNQLRRILKDPQLLTLLDIIIDHQVPDSPIGKGIPIGNLTSQFFANFYLSPLDHFLRERLAVKHYLRYMDDFIVFADDKAQLHETLDAIRNFLAKNLQLQLKEKVTKIAPVTEGVAFLGFRIYKSLVRIQRTNLVRFRKKIRMNEAAYIAGRISQVDLINSVSSMVAHIRHADSVSVRRKDFEISLRLA